MLLRRVRNNEDFLLVLEHHEDILLFDRENSPSLCTFYQVKSRKGAAPRLSDFLRARGKDGDLPSDLGRLYQSGQILPKKSATMVLVCNLQFTEVQKVWSAMDADVARPLDQLPLKEGAKLRDALAKQLGCGPGDIDLRRLRVERASLSIDDHETHTLGVVTRHLTEILPGRPIRPASVYESLTTELRRRSTLHKDWNSVAEYVASKAIGPTSLRKMLEALKIGFDWASAWELARSQLQVEEISFARLHRLQQGWTELEIGLLGSDDQNELQSLLGWVKSAVEAVAEPGRARLLNWLDLAVGEIAKQQGDGFTDRDPAFVEAAILLTIMRQQ